MHPHPDFNFEQYVNNQVSWSIDTFGPGSRRESICKHIEKECKEIRASTPEEALEEWIDVIILGLDGAWRTGADADDIINALCLKAAKNRTRKWPDWRTLPEGVPSEHIREEDDGA